MRRTFSLLVLTAAASPHRGLPTPATPVSGDTSAPAIAAPVVLTVPAAGTAAIGAAVAASARPEAPGRGSRAMGEHRRPGTTSEHAPTDAAAEPLVLPKGGRGPSSKRRHRIPSAPHAGRRRPGRVTAAQTPATR